MAQEINEGTAYLHKSAKNDAMFTVVTFTDVSIPGCYIGAAFACVASAAFFRALEPTGVGGRDRRAGLRIFLRFVRSMGLAGVCSGLPQCQREAQAPYPAGTLLNMKLEANGIRVETKGRVCANYPYLGMGSLTRTCR